MSIENVREYFRKFNMEDKIIELKESSATVELAARALNCEPARIAKTLSFHLEDCPILILTAGDVKIDNKKYKENKYEISEDKKCIEYCENLKKQNIEDSQSDKSEENL